MGFLYIEDAKLRERHGGSNPCEINNVYNKLNGSLHANHRPSGVPDVISTTKAKIKETQKKIKNK